MKLKSINPSNNQILGEVKISTNKEIKEKVKLARQVQLSWQEMGLEKRVEILRSVFKLLKKNSKNLAELASCEMGMLLGDAQFDVEEGLHYLNWYADNASKYLNPEITFESKTEIHQVYREPYGVAAVIVPWNFPFSNFVWQCGQNLIAGNTIVFKHSEEVPLFSQTLEEIFAQSELPKGVFNVIYGDGKIGDCLVHQKIDLICFTGSTQVGKYLYRLAAKKFIKAVVELGGSAPGIVCKDAKVDEIIDTIIMNRFSNCGQICDGLKRLIVHESRFDEVVSKIVAKVEKMKIGKTIDKNTNLGPMVAERQVKLLESQVKDGIKKGAKIVSGGQRPMNLIGAYYQPTVITNVKKNMDIWKEEVFGPVLPIISFNKIDQAIKLANDTKYGLGGYVFTQDQKVFDEISSKLKTGMVSQNNLSYLKPYNPFGGYKQSGMGREHGKYGFEDVTQVKVIAREK